MTTPIAQAYADTIIQQLGEESKISKNIKKWLKDMAQPLARYDAQGMMAVEQNVAWLKEMLDIADEEVPVLRLLTFFELDDLVQDFIHHLKREAKLSDLDIFRYLAKASPRLVRDCTGRKGSFRRKGLVDSHGFDSAAQTIFEHIYLQHVPQSALSSQTADIACFREMLCGAPVQGNLDYAAFEHLSVIRDMVTRLLKAAVETGEKGINILFYGPPGTGKTELCKAICDQLNVELYEASGDFDGQQEPCRSQRVAHLHLLQRVLRNVQNSVVLFDEMEDFTDTSDDNREYHSKRYQNRMLEENPIPILWTSNNVSQVDPAMLRRMTLAFELPIPTQAVRSRLWNALVDSHVDLSADIISHKEQFAARYRLPPAEVDRALRVMSLSQGSVDELHDLLEAKERLGRKAAPELPYECNFNQSLIHIKQGKEGLEQWLSPASPLLHVSLCLYGPPGTGKTMLVHDIAKRLGLELQVCRASDLVSCYIGQTEVAIAEAFRQARKERTFLLFDEADSLLCKRDTGTHMHDLRATNEMLSWMERHPLPFACTTNHFDLLDEAALRRFTFKLECGYLRAPEIEAAYAHYFEGIAPKEVLEMPCLTPADFAVASKKAQLMGCSHDVSKVRELLSQETAVKSDNRKPVGFMRSLH